MTLSPSSDTLRSSGREADLSCADSSEPEMEDVSAISPNPAKRDEG